MLTEVQLDFLADPLLLPEAAKLETKEITETPSTPSPAPGAET
jgi:hypothetical protein